MQATCPNCGDTRHLDDFGYSPRHQTEICIDCCHVYDPQGTPMLDALTPPEDDGTTYQDMWDQLVADLGLKKKG